MADDESHEHAPEDRLPSEIFEAIAALDEPGTQAELLARRAEAIRKFLELLFRTPDGNAYWTLYDGLAIQAWRDGLIPPKKARGRLRPHRNEAVMNFYRKAGLRHLYRKLGEEDPSSSAEERITHIAERYGLDAEWLVNVIRSSRHTIAGAEHDRTDVCEIVDMWLEWSAMRTK
ncbi:hypothetical protein ACQ5SP_03705 [Rhodovulum sp. YNF3179]|uniref:hypothetical protein n=1 Tax=Rhodovulum sp. YNF3179 TaxID=3425127 RepID=UPI003D34C9DF